MKFNIDEIFEIAEQIERNGSRFYRKAAKNVKELDLKKLMLELAEMEDQHEKVFAQMRAKIQFSEQNPIFDPNNEAATFLRSFSEGFIFDLKADSAELLKGKESAPDILRLAIGLEKDSVVFYLGIENIMLNETDIEHVRAIIKEEMGHITLLSKQLSEFI